MRRFIGGVLVAWMAASPVAMAQDETPEFGSGDRALEGRYDNPLRRATTVEEFRALPFDKEDYWGYEQLGLEPALVHEIRAGLELVYGRKYKEARAHFESVDERWPEAVMSSAIQALIWQALMLENFDYRYDDQYWVASAQAREDLEAALEKPGNEGWEHFLMAGMVGIEAIHTIRKEKYLPALTLAFDAMDHAQKAREAEPEFVDLMLADGLYNYWRTVITEKSKVLPDFGDHKQEGIDQMRYVETHGVFVGPAATLSLTFTWLEEHNMKRATTSTSRNYRAYPDSVINNLLRGQVQTYTRKYANAHATWDAILKVAPNNDRAHYWRGVTYLREGNHEKAEASLNRYLESENLEGWQKSYGYWRLGQSLFRQRKYTEARAAFKAAVAVDGHKSAKAALDRMKKAKKEGRIDY